VNKTWFKAPAGVYAASCYELCGIQHAAMHATVKVVPRTEYDAFVATRAQGGAALGQEEWQGVCQKCHRLDHKYIGPALGGNPLLADRKAIEVLLRNGRGQMPSVGRDWTSGQLDALVAYTKQFAKKGGNG
jgi:mono/diheme cytochrome c family protein